MRKSTGRESLHPDANFPGKTIRMPTSLFWHSDTVRIEFSPIWLGYMGLRSAENEPEGDVMTTATDNLEILEAPATEGDNPPLTATGSNAYLRTRVLLLGPLSGL